MIFKTKCCTLNLLREKNSIFHLVSCDCFQEHFQAFNSLAIK